MSLCREAAMRAVTRMFDVTTVTNDANWHGNSFIKFFICFSYHSTYLRELQSTYCDLFFFCLLKFLISAGLIRPTQILNNIPNL